VVAPSTYGDVDADHRLVVQIYYDVQAGAFKGINKDGGVDIITVSGDSSVISSGTERIERAFITNNGSASIQSQSGNWLSSVNRTDTGSVVLNFANGTFSAKPSCTCSAKGNGNVLPCSGQNDSNWLTSSQFIALVGSAGTAIDADFSVICMGPREFNI
jgi:hypothetical protein